MKFSTVLVTACGGDIGFGLGRILKMTSIATRLIGCDIHEEHGGNTLFDRCETVPRADSPDYLPAITRIIQTESVDLIIPTSEAEIKCLLKANMLDSIGGVPVLTANKKSLEIGLDKKATANFLESASLPYPWTLPVSEGPPLELPCILKSRTGAGSRSVALVDVSNMECYAQLRPNDIWQEYLRPDDQEYTCGIFASSTGEIRTLSIRRRLAGGFTFFGEVLHNPEIDAVLRTLAQKIVLRGCINAQLRLTKKGPVIFEINPRFSSTLVFRHLLGFQDVIWSIQDRNHVTLMPYTPPMNGTRFYRDFQEIIWMPAALDNAAE